jgi:hypothetical protein
LKQQHRDDSAVTYRKGHADITGDPMTGQRPGARKLLEKPLDIDVGGIPS